MNFANNNHVLDSTPYLVDPIRNFAFNNPCFKEMLYCSNHPVLYMRYDTEETYVVSFGSGCSPFVISLESKSVVKAGFANGETFASYFCNLHNFDEAYFINGD